MAVRVTSPVEMAAMLAVTVPPDQHDGNFSATRWLLDERNVALRIGPDLAMFEHMGPGTYQGHIWFRSKGREALERAEAMLDQMASDHGAKTIVGEIPARNRKTALFMRWLGFSFDGEIERPWGRVLICFREHKHALGHAMKVPLPLAS